MAKDKDDAPKPGMRVDVGAHGTRRINVAEQRRRREQARKRAKERGPVEDDPVARMRLRLERHAEAARAEDEARERIIKPLRKAEDEVNQRAHLPEPKESATPERAVRAGANRYVGDDGVQRLKDSHLDRLLAREAITYRHYDAGDRLREDWCRAGMVPVGASDPARVGGGRGPQVPRFMASEARADANDRVRDALEALGPRLSPAVVAVVLDTSADDDDLAAIGKRMTGRAQPGEARAALIELLKVALDTLADHYGLLDDSMPDDKAPGEVRQPRSPRRPSEGGKEEHRSRTRFLRSFGHMAMDAAPRVIEQRLPGKPPRVKGPK